MGLVLRLEDCWYQRGGHARTVGIPDWSLRRHRIWRSPLDGSLSHDSHLRDVRRQCDIRPEANERRLERCGLPYKLFYLAYALSRWLQRDHQGYRKARKEARATWIRMLSHRRSFKLRACERLDASDWFGSR